MTIKDVETPLVCLIPPEEGKSCCPHVHASRKSNDGSDFTDGASFLGPLVLHPQGTAQRTTFHQQPSPIASLVLKNPLSTFSHSIESLVEARQSLRSSLSHESQSKTSAEVSDDDYDYEEEDSFGESELGPGARPPHCTCSSAESQHRGSTTGHDLSSASLTRYLTRYGNDSPFESIDEEPEVAWPQEPCAVPDGGKASGPVTEPSQTRIDMTMPLPKSLAHSDPANKTLPTGPSPKASATLTHCIFDPATPTFSRHSASSHHHLDSSAHAVTGSPRQSCPVAIFPHSAGYVRAKLLSQKTPTNGQSSTTMMTPDTMQSIPAHGQSAASLTGKTTVADGSSNWKRSMSLRGVVGSRVSSADPEMGSDLSQRSLDNGPAKPRLNAKRSLPLLDNFKPSYDTQGDATTHKTRRISMSTFSVGLRRVKSAVFPAPPLKEVSDNRIPPNTIRC